MKSSNKILLWAIAGIIVITFGLVLASRFVFKSVVEKDWVEIRSELISSGEIVKRSFDVRDFVGVETAGAFDVTIKQGADYSVEVEIEEAFEKYLEVEKQGTILVMDLTENTKSGATPMVRVDITMPVLNLIKSSGGLDVRFDGFSEGRLSVETSGAVEAKGTNGTYRELRIRTSGAANIDFRGIQVTTADVRMSGAGNAEIKIDGGKLEGNLSGVGKLVYYGSPESIDVDTSGVSKVSKGR
jgi:hypothetical protein